MAYESLKKHCLQIHKKPKKISGEVDLKCFFKKPSCNNTSSVEDDLGTSELCHENKIENAIQNDSHDENNSVKKRDIEVKEFSDKLDLIMSKIDNLEIGKKSLNKGTEIVREHVIYEEYDPLIMCRSVDDIIELYKELEYDRGTNAMYCRLCCPENYDLQSNPNVNNILGRFSYDDLCGISLQFIHLKSNIKRHFKKDAHIEKLKKFKEQENENTLINLRNKNIGMRIARICYDIYQTGGSVRSYEKEILKSSLNGLDIGDLNHSRRFIGNFRPYVAKEIQNRTKKFFNTRLEQTGFRPPLNIAADKGTNVHRTRQFTIVITIVPNSKNLLNPIYIGQPVVKSHNGNGVAESIKESLNSFDIIGSQIEAGSFDGQYFHLSVPEVLKEMYELESTFKCTLDFLHKSGTVDVHIRKDSNFDWLLKIQSTCKEIYTKFNWGKNYEMLIEACNELDIALASLTKFCDTRFANSVRFVFINIRKDFAAIKKCLYQIWERCHNGNAKERDKAGDALRLHNKIVNKKFCMLLSGAADIYDMFGTLVNLCQKVNILPHERYVYFINIMFKFQIMIDTIDHKECIKISRDKAVADKKDPKTTKVECLWPRYHNDLIEIKESGSYRSIEIKNATCKQVYQTRQSGTENNQIVKDPLEQAKTNILLLVKDLKKGLEENVYPQETKEVIEDCRNISDLHTFAKDISIHGAIVTGTKNSHNYIKSVRRITSSLFQISDNDIKENYIKFAKKMEIHIKKCDLNQMCSMDLIKDFLNTKLKLFEGSEITMHCICVASVKVSVESVVESLLSRYEQHFHPARQSSEEHALEEMLIAENGPCLAQSKHVLEAAMNDYWKKSTKKGHWHFIRSTKVEDFIKSEGTTLKRLLNEESALSFQDI